jgi:uncharacterized membrane protein YkvI
MKKWLNWLLMLCFMFLLTSCTALEKIGTVLVIILALVIAAVVGIILVYAHNKDKIGKAIGIAQDIKDTIKK